MLIKLLKESSSLLNEEATDKSDINVDLQFLSLKLTHHQLKDLMPEHLDAIKNLVTAIEDTKLFRKITALIPPDLSCWRRFFDEEANFGKILDKCGHSVESLCTNYGYELPQEPP